MVFDNIVRVYDKKMNLLAMFDGNSEGLSPEEMRNLMVSPTVHRETNGDSILRYQMLVNSEKWNLIKDPENIYYLNGHYYTALSDGAYQFVGEGSVRVVNVTLVETWYLLDKQFTQAYNCGLYVYAKAKFTGYTTDGATFTINASDCSNPGNSISTKNAWNQVKLWTPKNDDGDELAYGILKSKEYAPTNWENAPSGVHFSNFSVSGNTATVTVKAMAKTQVQKTYDYVAGGSYELEYRPYPITLDSVYVNSTTVTTTETSKKYVTSNKKAAYSYSASSGKLSLNYNKASNETINAVIVSYSYYDLGDLSSGATCTFAFGPEVVDQHTFVILPKADKKYKLTIDGVEYDDSEVRDARGAIMPRGSGGYAMWAALKNSGWSLGVCDVIADGFDASIDYGCFNIECDMQNVLYIVQYIQELYGGILDFDSENKQVNYRAENSEDYQSYNDGFNDWTGYEFREGKNMTDQPQITWDNELITRGYLLGYGNLNVKDVNNGKTYIENFSYTNDVYEGYLEQPLIYDTRDDGGKNQLLYWGKKELAKKCKPRKKLTANVTDIRTAQGYEQEVFDLNDIVRVYYRDSETGKETYEEKRITLWEYNAFALWDCTVELGDKTQNFSEVFKLIYNNAVEKAPQTNASGQISSDEVVVEIPNLDDFAFDFEGDSWFSSFGGYGGGGYGSLANISDYIDLIVRKTTEHTDAIAGLILQANELYASTELFSTYQSVSENMVSDTYAGLKTYADAEIARVELVAEGYYRETLRQIGSLETYTRAGFESQASQNAAFSRQFSEMDVRIYDLDGSLKGTIQSLAEFKTEVTKNYATTATVSKYVTELEGKISTSEATIRTWASKNFASITLEATVDGIGTGIYVTNSYTYLRSRAGTSVGYVGVSTSGRVDLISNYGIYIGTSGTTISIKGRTVSWKSTYVITNVSSGSEGSVSTSGTTITYLGQ